MATGQTRVRFAPSPVGELHLGGARTALYNYLFARQTGGAFVLRLEDPDARRPSAEFEARLLEGLRWLGLSWDEGPDIGGPYAPYRQSQRQEHYRAALEQLLAAGRAYPCYCTPAELAEEHAAALRRGERPRYSGRCADLTRPRGRGGSARPRAIRFRLPPDPQVTYHDLVRGPLTFDTAPLDDFVIYRPEQRGALYNLAVTVDDHEMQISHVIRGEEHLLNTPRQVLLYRALGWELPIFVHLPLIRGQERKLSRRESVASIAAYRSHGFLPEAVLNCVARLGWPGAAGDPPRSLPQLVESLHIERLARGPATFDVERLFALNRQCLRSAPLSSVTAQAQPFLLRAYGLCERSQGTAHTPAAWLALLVDALRAETPTLEALADAAAFCLPDSPPLLTPEAQEALSAPRAAQVIGTCAAWLRPEDVHSSEAANQFFTRLRRDLKAQHGLSGKQVMFPLHAVLTGTMIGPCLGIVATLLGYERCKERLAQTGLGTGD